MYIYHIYSTLEANNKEAKTMTTQLQVQAIRQAIRALETDQVKAIRANADADTLKFYGEEIEALHAAIATIKQHDALKTMLKALIAE
jgi:hypothetical protein